MDEEMGKGSGPLMRADMSVFMEFDCGCWKPESKAKIRERMKLLAARLLAG